MSSVTVTLTGNTSELSSDYCPPIELNGNYVIGLIDFQTFNSIPNIDETNNKFYYDNDVIEIPTGSYEIEDINEYLKSALGDPNASNVYMRQNIIPRDKTKYITLQANNNTLKCEIRSNCKIDFSKKNTIGPLLGFKERVLQPNKLHESDLPVSILKVNALIIECNIVSGAYKNNKLVHIIHEFFPTVPPGYKIVEVPAKVIYLPVNTQSVNNITLTIKDQEGRLINFRGEEITVRLHLKQAK